MVFAGVSDEDIFSKIKDENDDEEEGDDENTDPS